MTERTQAELERVRRDIASCRAAMNNPKVGLFAMKRLYAVYGSLLRQAEQLEIDLAIQHVTGEPDEKELSHQPHPYYHG